MGRDFGASTGGPGSRASTEPVSVSAASGFDPSRGETELFVSDRDKELSWRELDDATLGKFARYFIIEAGKAEQRRADNDEWPMLALRSMHAGIALCRMTQETNAGTYTLILDGIRDCGGPMGDWEIRIRRLRAPRESDGSPKGGDEGSVHDSAAIAQTPPPQPEQE